MLVLTRKLNEEIVIPELAITIKLLNVRGDRVAIGVEAPRSVEVHRLEKHAAVRPSHLDLAVCGMPAT